MFIEQVMSDEVGKKTKQQIQIESRVIFIHSHLTDHFTLPDLHCHTVPLWRRV